MIRCPWIEVVSAVSLANWVGWWPFLRETVHSMAVVADGLRLGSVREKEGTR